jgi:ADP-ribose pyrophosphatase YjhB (NUDIX family)
MSQSRLRYGVGTYIVRRNAVLLLWHEDLGRWVPPGGRLELAQGESPHEAALRHAIDECGLAASLSGAVGIEDSIARPLPTPAALQELQLEHNVTLIDFVYFATTDQENLFLNYREARAYHWFTESDLVRYPIVPHIRAFASEAIKRLSVNDAPHSISSRV